ncbi:MAG: hypothetical protein MJE77_13495 [Proteobacteria bacterium]|nr:hypothetical protein [Pseudomonadota bacterium]
MQRTPSTGSTGSNDEYDWNNDPNMLAAYGFCPLESESNDQSHEPASSPTSSASIDSPRPAINKPGFIDNDDGSNIRTGPAELFGQPLTAQPLPPATRVFVSGQHPEAPTWWYASAHLPEAIVRGYVQNFRVNTDLPEPSAKLYQIKSADTVEALARREFSASVRDGHDLRYYENVLLAVNRDKNRAGIKGTFQDPGIFGGGANNIQLEAGRRIWLVSPAYARSLEGMVPDGSLTNGGYAKVKRVLGHIDDLVQSVTDSPQYFGEVAGEYAEAIKDHLPEIIGITAGFILAESASAFLAATPTGVGQLAAVVIQLGLAAFGASFAIDAGIEALKHGEQWLTLAWTAKGDPSMLTEASKEFLKMLVSIATVALAILGVRGNVGKGLKIADAIKIQPPKVGWSPAMVTPEGVVVPGGPVFTPGSIATSGPVDIGISAMTGIGSGGSKIKPGESKATDKAGKERTNETGHDSPTDATGEVKWTSHGGKHVPSNKVSWAEIVKGTKRGPAKYKNGVNIEALERHVWQEGTNVTNGKPWKVMEFADEIGASGGKSSRWVRVEESASTIHGHPITEAEFRKLTKVRK